MKTYQWVILFLIGAYGMGQSYLGFPGYPLPDWSLIWMLVLFFVANVLENFENAFARIEGDLQDLKRRLPPESAIEKEGQP